MANFVNLLLLGIFMSANAASAAAPGCEVGDVDSMRFDCHPEANPNESDCVSRGCCWRAATQRNANYTKHSGERLRGIPYCFYPSTFGYKISNVKQDDSGWSADLSLASNGGPYGADVKQLRIVVYFEDEDRLHFKIFDPANSRYEVPIPVPAPPAGKIPQVNYIVKYSEYPFGLQVIRATDHTTIFNSSVGGMIFEDQFLQISSLLPSSNLYGLGEHVAPMLLDLDYQTISLMARDRGTPHSENLNLYGVHPFYLNVEKSGHANGVLFLNSNPMDIALQPTPAITYRSIGGIMDFYVFMGSSPNEVVQQYLEVVGLPYMPPYWSLGFHLCRWGYDNATHTAQVVNDMRKMGIPQDVQWNDIDYMDRHLDFTYDKTRYSSLPDLVDDLHKHGQRYVMITDPGISSTQSAGSYLPFDDGLKMDVFLKNSSNQPIIGSVWPGETAFPDFSHPNAIEYWTKQVKAFHAEVPFDGLWIDMNEVSNFVVGSVQGCPNNSLENPPYKPGLGGDHMSTKTLCMSAKNYNTTQYNMHSLYGYFEAVASMSALKTVLKERSIVISRSTYPNSGAHGGHWLGDNNSNWPDLYLSIPGVLLFNMFGIPLVGADICGFGGSTTPELCTRWMQVGAFYPFSRNHNSIGSPPQEPSHFSPEYADGMRKALLIRYSLLPSLYTLFWQAHAQGATVARPLFFEFPKDPATLSIDKQFLWGAFLLISPVVDADETSVKAYFPADRWYDFYTGAGFDSKGESRTLTAELDTINLHLRGGYVTIKQDAGLTTTASRMNNFSLTVALSATNEAQGVLYLDDGVTLDSYETGQYSYITYQVNNGTLVSANNQHSAYTPTGGKYVQRVLVLGVDSPPKGVMLNKVPLSDSDYHYEASTKVMVVDLSSHNVLINSMYTIAWL
eukprot:scpid26772/ scgid2150/ Lysosomal alpha-glucosidase; Acid maltase